MDILRESFANGASEDRFSEARAEGMMDALDLVQRAGLICDGSAQILHINRSAEALLGPNFCTTARAIDFDHVATEAQFREMVQRALQLQPPQSLETRLQLRRPAHLTFRSTPLVRYRPPLQCDGMVLVLVAPESASLGETLSARYRLTSAEMRVVLRMADGASICEIADRHKVRPATVRSQLKSIFVKMNIHRQSQLVALIGRLRSEPTALD